MPTDLEDLIEFLHHGNTPVRQISVENLVGYSRTKQAIFKTDDLAPIQDLKLLVKDYPPIAKNVLTILVNLSGDEEVLQSLVQDDDFLKLLLSKITSSTEPHVDLVAMLLANLAKSDDIRKILKLTREIPKPLSTSDKAMDQLMDCFVKGAGESYNKNGNYDYLAYFFADMAKFPEGRDYFVKKQDYDGVVPISKLVVFTEHKSNIRRKGVASTIKNVAFAIESHPMLMAEDEVDILPYLLLPIMGPEDYDDEDSMNFPDSLQLLPDTKRRDPDLTIVTAHLETLMILTHTRPGREKLRKINVYPIVRETHLHVDNDDVRDICDRLVQVLMRDDEPERRAEDIQEEEEDDEDDEDDKLVPIG